MADDKKTPQDKQSEDTKIVEKAAEQPEKKVVKEAVKEPKVEKPIEEKTLAEPVGSLSLPTEENEKNVQSFDFEVSAMALDDKTQILSITTDLGIAYTSILGVIQGGSDALTNITAARQIVNTQMTAGEYDYAAPEAAAFRTVEKKLVSDVQPVMKPCCAALETYSKAAYSSKKFRDKWNSTSSGVNDPFFTSAFRQLWRDQMAEELIVKIGTITKASGSWPAAMTTVNDVADVKVATTAVLPNTPTYANGSSGVGATLTAGANAALAAIDGVTLSAGDRLLVKNQASALQNGIYVVTSIGSASVPWMLTRATDADQSSASEVAYGLSTTVTSGSTNAAKKYYMSNTTAPFVMGTTSMDWTQTTICDISLDENLEVRVVGNGSAPTTDEIVATLIVQKSDLTTSLQTVTIPVGTAVGTRFTIGTTSIKGVTISAVSIATDNGVDGDLLEIWVKSAA